MGGIYGEFLAYFPELFDDVAYFEREPRVASGYDIKADGTTDAIVLTEKELSLKLGNYNTDSHDVLSYSDKEFLFAPEDTPLKVGYSIIHPREQVLYTLIGKADWDKEAGFIRFQIELTPGPDGSEEPVTLNPGAF